MARAHQGQGDALIPITIQRAARRPDHPPGEGDPRGKFAKIIADHQRIGFAQALDGVRESQGDADVGGATRAAPVAGAVAHQATFFPCR